MAPGCAFARANMMASSHPSQPSGRTLTYAGIFLVAQATLMLEVLLTRITSVTAWYHLAFFVISLAMLGMTAGAIVVFSWPEAFRDEDVSERMAQSALGFAIAIPVSVGIGLSVSLLPVIDLMGFVALFAIGGVLALPFLLGGITLTLALTRAKLAPSTAYGVDLTGAASGCALIILVLSVMDAPSAALLSAAIAALGAGAFGSPRRAGRATRRSSSRRCSSACAPRTRVPPIHRCGRPGSKACSKIPRATCIRAGTRTRASPSIARSMRCPAFWAKGRNTPARVLAPLDQAFIKIDGAAGTVMARYRGTPQQHDYLAWDVTSAAHHLRPHGAAAVIGVGGGRDVLEAARAGHEPVVGIELNRLRSCNCIAGAWPSSPG